MKTSAQCRNEISDKITTEKKKKGTNYGNGHPCTECNSKRTIRGKLCVKCREEIRNKSN